MARLLYIGLNMQLSSLPACIDFMHGSDAEFQQ